MQFSRTARIERAEGAEPGVHTGILATSGEASDGHILNIKGLEVADGAPLLFGHDDRSGENNLGSWLGFERKRADGVDVLRGTAQIELEGDGERAERRRDVDLLVSKGHIGSFSVRWEPISEPVRRTNLAADHPAYVEEKAASFEQRYGMYFEASRMLEGSIVTIPADREAVIGRSDEIGIAFARLEQARVAQAPEEFVAQLRELGGMARNAGLDVGSIINASIGGLDVADAVSALDGLEAAEFNGTRFFVPAGFRQEPPAEEIDPEPEEEESTEERGEPTEEVEPMEPAEMAEQDMRKIDLGRYLEEPVETWLDSGTVKTLARQVFGDVVAESKRELDEHLYRVLGRIAK